MLNEVKYATICSGIEAPSVAMPEWEPLWFSEIEPFPSAVLSHRYPAVPNLGDMTQLPAQVATGLVEAPEVLIGGTPCQAFSVAGMREGLRDGRGQLTLTFVELADEIDNARIDACERECVIVWENVPGVLSSKDNAFGCFLGALAGESCELQPPGRRWENAGCVYGPKRTVAWRVLDAQHFGLAQRRKRVFVVASARAGFDPSEILFEFDGVRRDSAPRREAGESITHEIAPSLTASGRGVARVGDPRGQDPVVVTGFRMAAFGEYANDDTASTMKARDHKDATDLVVFTMQTANTKSNGLGISGEGVAYTLDTGNGQAVAAIHGTQDPIVSTERAHALGRNNGGENALVSGDIVRRLTPVECERLMGFPDNYTQIPWRNSSADQCPDGHRYKALGNSMAVPIMRWLCQRLTNHLSR